MNPYTEPTPHLRFVMRDGEKVLQKWFVDPWDLGFQKIHGNGTVYAEALGWSGEWRDVPMGEE